MEFKVKLAGTVGVVVLLVVSGWFCSRQVLQHRAIYPGGLTFVGAAQGPLGSVYHRAFLWRAPGSTDPLPGVSVHIDGVPTAFDGLTPAQFEAFGGTIPEGGIYDDGGTLLQYRFTDGRLTWLSLQANSGKAAQGGGGHAPGDLFALSVAGKAPITLPVSRKALVQALGRPARSPLVFAQ